MALVSVRNFVTPLKNRVHLGVIFFTVTLFTVFRAAGGALTLSATAPRASINVSDESRDADQESQRERASTRSMPASLDELNPSRELSKLGLDAEPSQRAMPRTRQEVGNGDFVDRMIEVEKPASKRPATPNQADLEEVERRLGLR